MSNNFNMDSRFEDLKKEAIKLVSLLDEDNYNPGLMSWCGFLNERLLNIIKLSKNLGIGKGDEKQLARTWFHTGAGCSEENYDTLYKMFEHRWKIKEEKK